MKDLQSIRSLCAAEQYSNALAAIAELKQAGFQDSALLVLEAIALQMSEGDEDGLEQAKVSLLEAAALDENHPEAHLEAGYFLLNVGDDAEAATPHFDAALSTLQSLVTEAVSGMAKCLQETEGDAAAAQFLETAARRVLDPEAIKEKL